MSDCIFCRIVSREIPATEVGRTDDVVAFRDLDPKAPTHVLVVPVKHVSAVRDATGPEGEKREAPDLVLAQQAIDTLAMLAEKTRGNLDADEERLLQSVLYEVRMCFVRAERGK